MENIEQKVLEIMKKVFEVDNIDNTCSQENCGKWDSLHHLNLIFEFEEAFKIDFDPSEIDNAKSVRDIVETINSKLTN
jgi:acyl carrier protein